MIEASATRSVDATPGVEWEIDQVSRLVGLPRLLIILPPGEDILENQKRSPEWYQRWAALQRRREQSLASRMMPTRG